MTRARAVRGSSFVACLALACLGAAAPAQPEPDAATPVDTTRGGSSLEITGALGPSVVFGDPANPEYARSFTRVGVFGELGVAYRSSYFVDPFISVGYATLAKGESVLPPGRWGPGGTLEQHLGIWTISPGITMDIWRFRPRVGLGLAVVVQSFELGGDKSSSTQLPIVSQFGLGFTAFDLDRFRLDLEARAVVATGADVTFATFDAVLRGDLFYFASN